MFKERDDDEEEESFECGELLRVTGDRRVGVR